MNQSIAAGSVRTPEIVLRQPYWIVIEFVLAVGLGVTHFTVTAAGSFWGNVTGGGAIGALISLVYLSVYRYEVGSGKITVRDLYRSRRTVDLTRLTSAGAPARRRNIAQQQAGWRNYLVLSDDQGATVRLSFSGTQRGPRRQLLAAIEPYVMADGVSRTGLIREALDGALWWPRTR
jgi:hypothetical protein